MAVHVFDTMGTTVSIRFPVSPPPTSVLRDVEQTFEQFDRRFSLYRHDSELSRIAIGALALHRSSHQLRDTYAEALEWAQRTGGVFTPHRPDGAIDLSGIVKAEAIEGAGRILDASDAPGWVLNAGGDILTRAIGEGVPGRIGIVDPDSPEGLLCTVALAGSRRAVATSGTSERGEHVWRVRHPENSGRTYRQVSVVADYIVTADVVATALLAGGAARCDALLERFDVDALIVDDHGELTASPGFRAAADLALR